MNIRSRATLALPLVILLAGIIIPLMMGAGADEAPGTDERPGIHAGRTAEEWETLAVRALTHGSFDRALSCAKSAELADAGDQYGELIADVRRGRWKTREIEQNSDRFLGRPTAELAFDEAGGVTDGTRVAIALPGESLWTMAKAWVAADRGVLPDEVDGGSADVYAAWDRLTAANGVRELEVGEEVSVPLLDTEMEAIADANRRDMESLREALAVARSGDPIAAGDILEGVEGRFALASAEYDELVLAIGIAEEDLRNARERELVVCANELVESSGALSRMASYDDLAGSLREAQRCLDEAEALHEEVRYAQPRAVVAQMLGEVGRHRVASDGSVRTRKPAGVSYTEAAAEAVEWLLGRELVWSGASFPMSDAKTADERAWARFLIDAARLARRNGIDVERLVTDRESESEIALPNPGDYFAARS